MILTLLLMILTLEANDPDVLTNEPDPTLLQLPMILTLLPFQPHFTNGIFTNYLALLAPGRSYMTTWSVNVARRRWASALGLSEIEYSRWWWSGLGIKLAILSCSSALTPPAVLPPWPTILTCTPRQS